MCLLNIFYLKCILTGMDVSGLSPGYPLTLEPTLIITIPLSPAWHKQLDQFRVWWRSAFRKTECAVIGWLSHCVVIGEQLRQSFSIAPPLAKTRGYWTRGLRRTFARTDIARHPRPVIRMWSSRRWRVSRRASPFLSLSHLSMCAWILWLRHVTPSPSG